MESNGLKMFRIDAVPYATEVIDLQIVGYRALQEGEGIPVGSTGFLSVPERPVTVAVYGGSPEPAVLRFFDVNPESNLRGRGNKLPSDFISHDDHSITDRAE